MALVSHYKFQDDAIDCVSGNNGTWNTTATYEQGKVGKCAAFYGTPGANYIVLDNEAAFDIPVNGKVSYCFWIKISTATTPGYTRMIIQKYNNTATGAMTFSLHTDDRLRMIFRNATTQVPLYSNSALIYGKWYHVAITYDSSNGATRMYIDSEYHSSNSQAVTMGNNATAVHIGCNSHTKGDKLYGLVDDIYYYNEIISDETIKAIYNLGRLNLNINDVFYGASSVKINIGDTWKTVLGMDINIGDSWKVVY